MSSKTYPLGVLASRGRGEIRYQFCSGTCSKYGIASSFNKKQPSTQMDLLL